MPTTPLCRCRVLYIGSSVPTLTKDGLQGIQEPLRQLYPVDGRVDSKGIDSWLSVWVNGLVLEYADGQKELFFPIQSLHYCAAVRYVNVSGYSIEGGGQEKFLPLDSPFANLPDTKHPPIFAAILRRTTGVKVLECHAFICTNVKAANALVRCCFHAYADSMYYMDLNENSDEPVAKLDQMKSIKGRDAAGKNADSSSRSSSPGAGRGGNKSTAESDSDAEVLRWSDERSPQRRNDWQRRQQSGDYETASISSSVAGRYKKKPQHQLPPRKAPSEAGIGDPYSRALVPAYGSPRGAQTLKRERRRAYSEMDLYGSAAAAARDAQMVPYGYPLPHMGPPMPFMPPPPHMMAGPPGRFPPPPGPPFHGAPMFGPHMPPHMPPMPQPHFMPPPGPAFGHRPPMHPHMMPGPMPMPLGAPPPPHPPHFMGGFGPQGVPLPPLPPRMMPPMLDPVYGTLPRHMPGFEEPHYANGHNGAPMMAPYHMGPNGDFGEQNFGHNNGYDTYQRQKAYRRNEAPSGRKSSSSSGSQRRSDSEDGQDGAVETRATIEHHRQHSDNLPHAGGTSLFKKTYLNEKAFSTSIQKEKTATPAETMTNNGYHTSGNYSGGMAQSKSSTMPRREIGSGSAVLEREEVIAVDYSKIGDRRRREIDEEVRNMNLSEPEETHTTSRNRATGGLRQHHMMY